MNKRRIHLEQEMERPEMKIIKECFVTMCVFIETTNSKDLEADIQVGDKQYHIEVSEVARNISKD